MRNVPIAAAGCAAAFLLPSPAPAKTLEPTLDPSSLRADGPSALTALLARFDRLPPGAERDQLEREIDRVAGQRYATVSRLYWYTDLAQAEAAAQAAKRPILALRMLGRLDEDLSCANSRLFRATLYANADVSKFLRENFVLYWSSERPVPKVTIDYGDGRKIESTTTGNSAHYVLDADGHVLDVLPGLYAPIAFKAELTNSLALARSVRGVSEAKRLAIVERYHHSLLAEQQAAWKRVARTPYILGSRQLSGMSSIAKAQAVTMSKARIELPTLRYVGLDAGQPPDAAMWAAVGQVLYGIGDLKGPRQPRPPVPVTDARSRALIAQLHGAATADELAQLIERLEHHLVADTALNQLQLRAQTSALIVADTSRMTVFETLNAEIYDSVFHTPKTDRWLGLLPRTDFTGVPNDGVVKP
ncbi:MAG: hypothetical protein ABI867_39955 [Kofleriaceae bacterium]